VSPDGTTGAFINREVEGDLLTGAPNEGGQWSAARLEKTGRDYITAQLADVVQLGRDEALVPLRVAYRRFGTVDASTGARSVKVITNEIVFGRTIKGVLVVGPGSKVRLGFSNTGELHSLNYDWPVYAATAEEQKVAPASVGLARLSSVLGVRTNQSLNTFGPAPAVAQYPWRASESVDVHDYLCGYLDLDGADRETFRLRLRCSRAVPRQLRRQHHPRPPLARTDTHLRRRRSRSSLRY
jgi:hypothetical protein